ncbi:Transcriptional regulator containing PAS, AAA-type ATPase, and DNA-binding Fis domains [Methylophilus rhizosphaerae]|uniref:Transcriptional regulator containing PAS, AAA-type ATPase, and DNA-binding Fis domains n=1 Tax=Methylophilus rhizosphaerae TaxID=492660 RepID=A0A1G9DX08_9PROT|nr:sigma 54-interacting transcriptional regulator [Methylophilus rhizosphaerae]SDK68359.1 Transcriptional regulator containing PAS, AAA-type ATPase, and DNA-binding Fis domains [Methylophilus rhizosphaerae]
MKMKQSPAAFFANQPQLSRAQGESLARMISLIMPDAAVFTVDPQKKISYWSPGAEKLLGYPSQALQGESCLTANRCIQCMRGCGLTEAGKVEAFPLQLQRSDGQLQGVIKYAMAFQAADGSFEGGLEILLPQRPAAETSPAADDMAEKYGLISHAPDMYKVFDMVRRVAGTDIPVLIRGDSGTGKELVARAIHGESARNHAPFVAINCATLNAGILESELFGHVKGAFTGAVRDHQGLFGRAEGGTLFLDEIAELPYELQAKLLRVLETGEYLPVGADRPLQANVRIVAATHKALREEVKAGRFRQDLLYRLRVIPIFIPSLQARKQDIPLIVRHLLKQQFSSETMPEISPAAMQKLLDYDWPGNVRELRNVMHYALVMCDGKQVQVSDLPPELLSTTTTAIEIAPGKPGRKTLSEADIVQAMAASQGNLAQAARRLGVGRTTLWRYRKLWQEKG